MGRKESAAGLEFTVDKKQFLRELALVRDASEKNGSMPILANVLLEASGDQVTLTASDLEISMRCSCPAQVKYAGSGTMPARKLLSYIQLLPDGDVRVKFQDDHWAGMAAGRNQARIAGMSREAFPELPSMPEPIAQLPLMALVSLIGRTSFAISAEESRFTLNAALLMLAPDGLTMVATDGHRLAFATAHQNAEARERLRLLVPKRAMGELAKLSADAESSAFVDLAMDENHLFFRVGTRLLIVRKLAGNFPDYERVLPSDGESYCAKLERAGLQAAIARVSQFADEVSRAVRVQFKAGEVKLLASCLESGESEETFSCEYAGRDVEIGFNAQYLMEFLSATPSKSVMFEVRDEKHAGELRPESLPPGEQYRYVVMPMRI